MPSVTNSPVSAADIASYLGMSSLPTAGSGVGNLGGYGATLTADQAKSLLGSTGVSVPDANSWSVMNQPTSFYSIPGNAGGWALSQNMMQTPIMAQDSSSGAMVPIDMVNGWDPNSYNLQYVPNLQGSLTALNQDSAATDAKGRMALAAVLALAGGVMAGGLAGGASSSALTPAQSMEMFGTTDFAGATPLAGAGASVTGGIYGSGISTGSNIGDTMAQGAIKGGITSGIQGRDPLTGALTGGLTGGFGSAVDLGSPIANAAAKGAFSSAITGGNPIMGAVSGGINSGVRNMGLGDWLGSLFGGSGDSSNPGDIGFNFDANGVAQAGDYQVLQDGSLLMPSGDYYDASSGQWYSSTGNTFDPNSVQWNSDPTSGGVLGQLGSALNGVGVNSGDLKTLLSLYGLSQTNKIAGKTNSQSASMMPNNPYASMALNPTSAGGALGTITNQPRSWKSSVAGNVPGYAEGGQVKTGPLDFLSYLFDHYIARRPDRFDRMYPAQQPGQQPVQAPIAEQVVGSMPAADTLKNARQRQMDALGLRSGGALSALRGMRPKTPAGGVQGPGTGQSDSIPAQLSDGEYVMDADAVSSLGDGSTAAGTAKLDQLRQNLRKHKRSAPPNKIPPKAKAPEAYMGGQ